MHIAAMSSAASAMSMARTPEAKEGPGPDHDGDSDDKSVGASQPVAAAPAGMGKTVNTVA